MDSEPRWITEKLVRAIHSIQLDEHGGIDGVRDEGMLSSAIARPRNAYAFSGKSPNLAVLAAAYAFGLAKNHAFLDGNKRTAAVVCETFLQINGSDLIATDEELYKAIVGIADGSVSEVDFSNWLQQVMRANS